MSDHSHLGRRDFLRASALAAGALALGGGSASLRAAGLVGRSAAGPGPIEPPTPAALAVLHEHFGTRPIRTGHVDMTIPEVAPDGRVVPVFIESDLPMTAREYVKAIHLIVDHNPDIYLAGFHLTPAIGRASIDTRIKMRRSSMVRAIAETSRGELWVDAQLVYVTLNGCV